MSDDFEASLPRISDEAFAKARASARGFTAVIMKIGPAFGSPNLSDPTDPVTAIVVAHAKRNLGMHQSGLLPIVCPIGDGSPVAGISIFTTDPDRTTEILEADPAVRAGVLTYEIHPTTTSTIGGPPPPTRAPA